MKKQYLSLFLLTSSLISPVALEAMDGGMGYGAGAHQTQCGRCQSGITPENSLVCSNCKQEALCLRCVHNQFLQCTECENQFLQHTESVLEAAEAGAGMGDGAGAYQAQCNRCRSNIAPEEGLMECQCKREVLCLACVENNHLQCRTCTGEAGGMGMGDGAGEVRANLCMLCGRNPQINLEVFEGCDAGNKCLKCDADPALCFDCSSMLQQHCRACYTEFTQGIDPLDLEEVPVSAPLECPVCFETENDLEGEEKIAFQNNFMIFQCAEQPQGARGTLFIKHGACGDCVQNVTKLKCNTCDIDVPAGHNLGDYCPQFCMNNNTPGRIIGGDCPVCRAHITRQTSYSLAKQEAQAANWRIS